MSAFFCTKSAFLAKVAPLLKVIMWALCYRFFTSVFSFCKIKEINENLSITYYASGIRLLDCSKLTMNWKNGNNVTAHQHDVIVKLFDITLFFLSSLVTGPSFMSISSLVLELWQFSFIREGPEIWKSEILLSEFCQIFGTGESCQTWGYQMLQKYRVTTFTFSELLRENQQGRGVNKPINIFSIT